MNLNMAKINLRHLNLATQQFADISNGLKTFCPSHSVQASQISSLKAESVGNSAVHLLGNGAALNACLHPVMCCSVHVNTFKQILLFF